ncbi:MAG: flavin reductase family protein [Kibdelosporangium sp.]
MIPDRPDRRPAATIVADPVGPAEFRTMMAGFPTGVGIVTTFDQLGRPWGMTCSSICSVALDPPTLLICLRSASPTLDALLRVSTFAVNLLHDGAQPAAELFASGDPSRFDRIRWQAAPRYGGPHLVDDAHSVADCVVTRSEVVGDHIVVFGEVRRIGTTSAVSRALAPLLYGRRRYASWPSAEPL